MGVAPADSGDLEDSSDDSEPGPQEAAQSLGRWSSEQQSYVGPSAGCTAVSPLFPLIHHTTICAVTRSIRTKRGLLALSQAVMA